MKFKGSFVPLITPFDHKFRVDQKALHALVEWHIFEGTDGIICSATTGEGPALSDAEKKKIAQTCIEVAAGRIPILVATGTSDTRSTVQNTEKALKWGAQGCLVVTPYYNRPTQKGCLAHFREVASVGLDVIAYHNPSRAAVRLNYETILEMSQIPNLVAIKESSHDVELIRKIIPRMNVFSGDDDLAFDLLKMGAVGTIATTSNVIPRAWKRMVRLCLEKKWEEAQKEAERFSLLSQAIFLETNPQGVKFALSWLGRCKPFLRSPLFPPEEKTQQEIKKQLIRLAMPPFLKSFASTKDS